jgi:hypothetical protein
MPKATKKKKARRKIHIKPAGLNVEDASQEIIIYMNGNYYHFTQNQIENGGTVLQPGTVALETAEALTERGVILADMNNNEQYGELTALLNLDAVIV